MSHRESGLAGIPIGEAMLFAVNEATRHGLEAMREHADRGDTLGWLEWTPSEALSEVAQDGGVAVLDHHPISDPTDKAWIDLAAGEDVVYQDLLNLDR